MPLKCQTETYLRTFSIHQLKEEMTKHNVMYSVLKSVDICYATYATDTVVHKKYEKITILSTFFNPFFVKPERRYFEKYHGSHWESMLFGCKVLRKSSLVLYRRKKS